MSTAGLPQGFQLIARDTVASTNDEAKRLAEADAADGTVVQAALQTAGRGRLSRVWESETGNLFCSIILRPQCAPMKAPELGFAASIAVAEAIAGFLPTDTRIRCKWPNDVLVNDRKVSGILLEAGPVTGENLDWLVLGIGINITSHPEDMAIPATSIAAEGGSGVSPDDVLAAVCRRFAYWRILRRGEGFAPLRKAWLTRAAGLGGSIRVELAGKTVSGTFEDLDGQGALILLRETGQRVKITAGDVFLPPAGS